MTSPLKRSPDTIIGTAGGQETAGAPQTRPCASATRTLSVGESIASLIDTTCSAFGYFGGVLSMARTSDPDSASSQFFVMHMDAPHLDAQYAGFGKLTDGFDVLDAIANVKTGNYGWYMQDVPREPVVIETLAVISK